MIKKNKFLLNSFLHPCPFWLHAVGFGQSDKPLELVYGEGVWTWQVLSLIEDVIQAEKVFLGGNSLGGYVCMNLAENEQTRVAGTS